MTRLELLDELAERMTRAYGSLLELAEGVDEDDPEFARLRAKADGVSVCQSYVNEMIDDEKIGG